MFSLREIASGKSNALLKSKIFRHYQDWICRQFSSNIPNTLFKKYSNSYACGLFRKIFLPTWDCHRQSKILALSLLETDGGSAGENTDNCEVELALLPSYTFHYGNLNCLPLLVEIIYCREFNNAHLLECLKNLYYVLLLILYLLLFWFQCNLHEINLY